MIWFMKKIDMSNSALGSNVSWVDFSEKAGHKNSQEFAEFRRHPIMLKAIEGTTYLSLMQNIFFFRKLEDHIVTRSLEKISSSDMIGAPIRLFTAKVGSKYITINRTTAKYAKNWSNIIDCFGIDILFNGTKVTEIGAGYGGESKVFFDIACKLGKTPDLGEYEVYDLPSSELLIRHFLDNFGYSVAFKKLGENKLPLGRSTKNLVISNAALSEMRGDLLWSYLNEIVLPASFGYFIVNFDSHSKPYEGGISNSEFYDWLVENGKNPRWLNEKKFLTNFDSSAAGSKLIVFGAEDDFIQRAAQTRVNHGFILRIVFRVIEYYSQKGLDIYEIIKTVKRKFFCRKE